MLKTKPTHIRNTDLCYIHFYIIPHPEIRTIAKFSLTPNRPHTIFLSSHILINQLTFTAPSKNMITSAKCIYFVGSQIIYLLKTLASLSSRMSISNLLKSTLQSILITLNLITNWRNDWRKKLKSLEHSNSLGHFYVLKVSFECSQKCNALSNNQKKLISPMDFFRNPTFSKMKLQI